MSRHLNSFRFILSFLNRLLELRRHIEPRNRFLLILNNERPMSCLHHTQTIHTCICCFETWSWYEHKFYKWIEITLTKKGRVQFPVYCYVVYIKNYPQINLPLTVTTVNVRMPKTVACCYTINGQVRWFVDIQRQIRRFCDLSCTFIKCDIHWKDSLHLFIVF